MIIDAHLHVWQVNRGDYGWLTPNLPIYRDYTIADAKCQSGVDGVVLVQAAPTVAETVYLLEQGHAAGDFVRGVVGWVDLAAPDAPARIAVLAQDRLLVGLRPMLQDMADPAWILHPTVAPALAAMAASGLTLDLLIRPQHLPHCLTLAARNPHLAMVIDHAAKPAIAAGAYAEWADAMRRITNHTGIVCKLSGLITEAGPAAGFDAVRPYAAHVIALFGPDRLLWGSDWPVLQLAAAYHPWLAHAQALVRVQAAEAEDKIFGGTAQRFYGAAGRGRWPLGQTQDFSEENPAFL
jgi:L-fuconolactonase